jgi:hypothetical protein
MGCGLDVACSGKIFAPEVELGLDVPGRAVVLVSLEERMANEGKKL